MRGSAQVARATHTMRISPYAQAIIDYLKAQRESDAAYIRLLIQEIAQLTREAQPKKKAAEPIAPPPTDISG